LRRLEVAATVNGGSAFALTRKKRLTWSKVCSRLGPSIETSPAHEQHDAMQARLMPALRDAQLHRRREKEC
jgi:hypothetical protein